MMVTDSKNLYTIDQKSVHLLRWVKTVVFVPIRSYVLTGSYWLAHPKPQLCDYCEDIIVHIDT